MNNPMIVIEVLFFAIIAIYLFIRLWSVLGTRTGHERPLQPFEEEESNVIILPNRNQVDDEDDVIIQEPFQAQLDQIRKYEGDFVLEEFEERATTAYRMIVESYHKGDIDFLKTMLDERVFKQFEKAIITRKKRKESIQNEFIGDITCVTEFVEVKGANASIEMKISSQQRLITRDAEGVIIDNLDESVLKIIEHWTFSRQLGDRDPTWLLSKTHTPTVH